MRSAVETRCGPSASTSSSSEIIELCADMPAAATMSRHRCAPAPRWRTAPARLLVVDREARLLDLVELLAQRLLARNRVRATLRQLHLRNQLALLALGEVREQQLAHRVAVRGYARAGVQVELDLALAAAEAAHAVDVKHVGPVEHAEAGRVGGPLPQFLEVGVGVLAQPGGVQRGHAKVGDAQPEAVLA